MSLINDALIDLEKRKNHGIQSESVSEIVSQTRGGKKITLKIVCVTFTLITVFFVGREFGQTNQNGHQTNSIMSEINIQKESVTDLAESIDGVGVDSSVDTNVDINEKIEIKPESVTMIKVKKEMSESNVNSSLIDEYVVLARDAISRSRLTLPENSSALAYINKIESLDASDIRLEQLKLALENQYLKILDHAIKEENYTRATGMLARIDTVISESSVKTRYQAQLDERLANQASVHERVQIETKEKVDESWVQESSESQSEYSMSVARELINQKKYREAEHELLELLKKQPNSALLGQSLVDLYEAIGDWASAQEILEKIESDNPSQTYINAKIAHHYHGRKRAIDILESDKVIELESYKAQVGYLAALYQQEKKYGEAEKAYDQLLRRFPKDPTFLLGYALVLDAQGKHQETLAAYRSLLGVGHSNQKVIAFVKKRIAEIEPNNLAEAGAW